LKHTLNLSQNYKLQDLLAQHGQDATIASHQISTQINPYQIQWDYVFAVEDNKETETDGTNKDTIG
jgi:hypothetical protein